ncbi:pyridoxal phosphate-dependent aminotransferase [Candidatus Peregrinibacteria bacterium]|nr:pyridoxal phosphate-dependent aminotransferase [Candidatus Peregrinibacteria bacterium]
MKTLENPRARVITDKDQLNREVRFLLRYIEEYLGDPIGRYFEQIAGELIKKFEQKKINIDKFLRAPQDEKIDTLYDLLKENAEVIPHIDGVIGAVRKQIEDLIPDIVSSPKIEATESAKNTEYAVRGDVEIEINRQDVEWHEKLREFLLSTPGPVAIGKIGVDEFIEKFDNLRFSGIETQANFLTQYYGIALSDKLMETYPIRANIGNSGNYTPPPKELVDALGKEIIRQNLRLNKVVEFLKEKLRKLNLAQEYEKSLLELIKAAAEKIGGYDKSTLNLSQLLPYSSVTGIKGLPQAIQRTLVERGVAKENDPDFIKRILLGNGSSEAIKIIFDVLVEEHDEVYFAGEKAIYSIYSAEIKRVGAKEKLFDPKSKKYSEIGPRARMIVFITPNNPTGKVMGQQEVDSAIKAIKKSGNNQTILLFDEAYRRMIYNKYGIDIAAYTAKKYPDQVFAIADSISKEQGMCGLRAGFAYFGGPIENMEFLNETYKMRAESLCSNTFGQLALYHALETGAVIDAKVLESRIKSLTDGFKEVPYIGDVKPPDGALYLWFNVRPLMKKMGIKTSKEFALKFAKECNVSTVEGSGFGNHPDNDNYIRFVVFLPESTNMEIARRMKNWVTRSLSCGNQD